MTRLTSALAIATTAIVLVACSASSSPSTATSAPHGGGAGASQVITGGGPSVGAAGGGGGGGANVTDPCTLLTQAEVTAVVGKQVKPGSSADNPKSCDFESVGGDGVDFVAGVNFADGSLNDFCASDGSGVGMSIEPVSGIGDGACFIHVGTVAVGSSLTFSKAGRLFQTFDVLAGVPIADIKTADTALAQKVLAHL
jgi:hypothetical protein